MARIDTLGHYLTDMANSIRSAIGSNNPEYRYLPEEYQQVEYIKSTGTQYIDVRTYWSNGMYGQCEVSYDDDGGFRGYIFGSHNTVEPYGRNGFFYNDNSGGWELGYGDYCPFASASLLYEHKYNIEFCTIIGRAYLKVDGQTLVTNNNTTTFTNKNALIFTNSYELGQSNPCTSARLYSLKIYNNNGALNRDFVPCYRKSDNVIGLYDMVYNTFYTNAGTGEFLKGDDVENVSPFSSLYPKDFDTTLINNLPKITDTSYLFYNGARVDECEKILNMIDFDEVKNCYYMFGAGGSAYKKIKVPINITFNNLIYPTSCESLFVWQSEIPEISFSSSSPHLTSLSQMFFSCSGAKKINLDVCGDNIKNLYRLCNSDSELEEIDFKNTVFSSKLTNLESMFENCTKLTTIKNLNLDTSNVTNVTRMFAGCGSLLDLSSITFDIPNVTSCSNLFYNCQALTNLPIMLNASNVTNFSNMFANCNSLTSIDLSEFTKSGITNFSVANWFNGCSSLSSLVLPPNLNTSTQTDMSSIFNNCTNLAVENYLPSFSFAKATNINNLIAGCQNITGSITLTGFDTNTTNYSMVEAFKNSSVTKVNGFTTSRKCTSYQNAFNGCTNLVEAPVFWGGATRDYESNSCFYGCSNLERAEIGTGTTYVGSSFFAGCSKLSEIIFPSTITGIGGSFIWNSGIKHVHTPSSVTSLGSNAFSSLTVEAISVPGTPSLVGSVTSSGTGLLVHTGRFQRCPKLKYIWVNGNCATNQYSFRTEYLTNNASQRIPVSEVELEKVYIDAPRATVEAKTGYPFGISASKIICNNDSGWMTLAQFKEAYP